MNRKFNMKKYMLLGMALLLISFPGVMAGTGSLRISPEWPTMVASPAEFTVWCQSGTSYDVHILFVITQECYDGMSDTDVVIQIDSTEGTTEIYRGAFDTNGPVTGMGGVYVPDTGVTNGARYTVSSLKDHLDEGLATPLESDDAIYWTLVPLFTELGEDPEEITVTVNSGAPRMLVYLMGRSEEGLNLLDMRIPPTPAGFVVPEVVAGSVMAAAAMFSALGIFAYKKKHTQIA